MQGGGSWRAPRLQVHTSLKWGQYTEEGWEVLRDVRVRFMPPGHELVWLRVSALGGAPLDSV